MLVIALSKYPFLSFIVLWGKTTVSVSNKGGIQLARGREHFSARRTCCLVSNAVWMPGMGRAQTNLDRATGVAVDFCTRGYIAAAYFNAAHTSVQANERRSRTLASLANIFTEDIARGASVHYRHVNCVPPILAENRGQNFQAQSMLGKFGVATKQQLGKISSHILAPVVPHRRESREEVFIMPPFKSWGSFCPASFPPSHSWVRAVSGSLVDRAGKNFPPLNPVGPRLGLFYNNSC